MERLDEKQVAVARIYSRAMFDLAESEGSTKSLLEELRDLLSLLRDRDDLRAFIISPMVEQREREKVLEGIFRGRASDLLVDGLQILNKNGRLSLLPTIVETFREAYQEHHGHIDVQVTSAAPLSAAAKKGLVAAATRLAGREAVLVESIDESLIGGMVVRVGDRKIDTSVRTELFKLRHALDERSALEIYRSRQEAAG
jgi:F-type H+-transporting ATPase subunit delta